MKIFDFINKKYSANKDSKGLEEITVPNGIKTLNDNAFYNFTNLKYVHLPKSLKTISENAFKNCYNLKEIIMPDSVKNLCFNAFGGCTGLEKIVFSKNIKEIVSLTFSDCKNLKEVVLPKNLEICYANFMDCSKLEEITIPENLTIIGSEFARNCTSLSKVKLNKNLEVIDYEAFENCKNLKEIELPKNLKKLKTYAFKDCTSLQNITLPANIKEYGSGVFLGCKNLKEVTFTEFLTKLNMATFQACESLETIKSNNIVEAGVFAFKNCINLKNIDLTVTKIIDKEAFAGCKSLTELELKNVVKINEGAFKDCTGLEKIYIPSDIFVEKDAFLNCNFNYVYKTKDGKEFLISNNKINDSNYNLFLDINIAKKYITNFDLASLINSKSSSDVYDIINILSKRNYSVDQSFIDYLYNINEVEEFRKDFYNLKFFATQIKDIDKVIKANNNVEKRGIYNFANIIGCFSYDNYLDKDGNPTQTYLSQKACTIFAQILKDPKLVKAVGEMFWSSFVNKTASQEFLDFISQKGKNKTLVNLETLIELDELYSNVIIKITENFKDVESYRHTINSQGKPCTLSWKDAILKFLEKRNYSGVNEYNEDIASTFAKHNIRQTAFDDAVHYRKIAKLKNVGSHILKKHLKEENVLTAIESVKDKTAEMLDQSKELLDNLYEKYFTYEMLDKYDSKNAIIGLYTDCCANLLSMHYGKNIAIATMVENNVQNIVVKDKKDNIIAKGAIYVNKKDGYAVINDFELNKKYRKKESDVGVYEVKPNHKDEQERNLIFNTFLRGINEFIKEYDLENPTKPLKQVVVGMGYNRFKRQMKQFPVLDKKLKVPSKYRFCDAEKQQRLIYSRENNKILDINELEK